MLVTESINEIQSTVKLWKRQKLIVGYVPTMGALHDGHLSLINKAKDLSDRVVVSIFVNPKQFSPDEDFNEYPRDPEQDLKLCRKCGVAALFMPDESEMYSGETFFRIDIRQLNKYMCGASRPGFFEGITLVVNKFFNIVNPDIAVFGQKDIQQFVILKQMAKEFNHDVRLIMGKTDRANDGLAHSSRNTYLNNDERLTAPALYRSLKHISQKIKEGVVEPSLLVDPQRNELEAKGFKIDYLNVFTLDELRPVEFISEKSQYIIAGAVYLGRTRLIDNILIDT